MRTLLAELEDKIAILQVQIGCDRCCNCRVHWKGVAAAVLSAGGVLREIKGFESFSVAFVGAMDYGRWGGLL